MVILVINAGSSSLKYQLIDIEDEKVLAKGSVERIGIGGAFIKHKVNGETFKQELDQINHEKAVEVVFEALINDEYGIIKEISDIDAIGHRVVHGGEEFRESMLINDEIMQVLKDNADIAPLHNPANIACIEACRKVAPDVSMVGVFDTAFHSTIPPKGYLYAIPMEAYTEHKIRRYGFHGISHSFVSSRAAEIFGKDIKDLKIITCHLGNGSSVAAIKNGEVIDTSMGFTPLEGLIMGTRSGDIDPTIIQYLVDKADMSLDKAIEYLNKKSGVLGISGLSSDFRDLEDAAAAGDEQAELAMDMFSYRVKKYIGAYISVMDGVDIIVFTAGIGERGPIIRDKVLSDMSYVGLYLDKDKNDVCTEEDIISTKDSKVSVMVIPTNEELMIAKETKRICS